MCACIFLIFCKRLFKKISRLFSIELYSSCCNDWIGLSSCSVACIVYLGIVYILQTYKLQNIDTFSC